MSKYTLLLVALLVVALPTFALAAWNATSMSSYPQCQPLAQEMSDCKTAVPVSIVQLNEQNMMCPMVMPVKVTVEDTRPFLCPMKAEEVCPPAPEVKTVTMMVPVSIQEIKGNDTITCSMNSEMANSVVLIPTSSNGQQMMQPVLLKPNGSNTMILVPLDETIAAPVQVSLIVDGNMVLAPIDVPASLSSDSLCISADQQNQTKVMSDQNSNY
ncbi:MAG: hypothetical protein ACYC63_07550 [Armatimonadota bacterium]